MIALDESVLCVLLEVVLSDFGSVRIINERPRPTPVIPKTVPQFGGTKHILAPSELLEMLSQLGTAPSPSKTTVNNTVDTGCNTV
jgi:hypothetical protein